MSKHTDGQGGSASKFCCDLLHKAPVRHNLQHLSSVSRQLGIVQLLVYLVPLYTFQAQGILLKKVLQMQFTTPRGMTILRLALEIVLCTSLFPNKTVSLKQGVFYSPMTPLLLQPPPLSQL